MKDKEKQIEEMAKVIRNTDTVGCFCETCDNCKYSWHEDCDSIKQATKLFNAGYRKIENSVVLSKEEYERLKHYEWRVTSGVCMTQKEWFDFCNEDSNRRTCLRIEEREKERKETAEKILNDIFRICKQRFNDTKGYTCWGDIEIAIQQYAKQIGIEIKE